MLVAQLAEEPSAEVPLVEGHGAAAAAPLLAGRLAARTSSDDKRRRLPSSSCADRPGAGGQGAFLPGSSFARYSAGRPASPHPLGRDVELPGIGVLLRPPRGGRLAVAGHPLALATRHFGLPALRPPAQPAQHPPLHHRKAGGEGGGRG